ncbi:hypothetical protein GOP47_0027116 [Adiantum capillus-veneris]|nr:hypothetical protein GOP47_0027116 [Adiantum capillus-veneris]
MLLFGALDNEVLLGKLKKVMEIRRVMSMSRRREKVMRRLTLHSRSRVFFRGVLSKFGSLTDLSSVSKALTNLVLVEKQVCTWSLLVIGAKRLPNDLATLCLVRLARKYHHTLRGVCKTWKSFVTSRLFVSMRKILGLSEGWIYVLSRDSSEYLHWDVLDPSQRRWMTLPPVPPSCSRRFGMACEVLDGQFFFIGGCEKYEDPTNEVHVFDSYQHKWKEVACMDVARCYLASGALDGKIYAIGGTGTMSGALTSWEMFDPEKSQWHSYDDPSIIQDLGESLVMDGKIYVRHVSPTDGLSLYAARYDSVSKVWTLLDDEMTKRWYGPAVVLGKDAYMLDQTFGVKLLTLDKANKCWDPVGRISPLSIKTPCRLAVVGSTLFVVGRGLKVLAIDMEKSWKATGLLVTSPIMGTQIRANNVVVCCKTIYI